MKLASLFAVAVLFSMVGCAALDGFFGVDPVTKTDLPGPAPAETAGGVLGMWLPGAGALAGLATGIYQFIRARRFADAGKLAYDEVSKLLDTNKDGKVDSAELANAVTSLRGMFGK